MHVASVQTVEELQALSPPEVFIRVAQLMHPSIAPRDMGLIRLHWGKRLRADEERIDDEQKRVIVECSDPASSGGTSIRVVRRQPDGTWRVVVTSERLRLPG